MTEKEIKHMDKIIKRAMDEISRYYTYARMTHVIPEQMRKYLADAERACWKLAECIDEEICRSYASEKSVHDRDRDSDHMLVENDRLTNVEINENSSLAWIEMSGRLPSRKSMSSGRETAGASYTHLTDRDIRRAFIDHPGFRMAGKAELLFYFEYASNIVARDVDNVNIKPTIDALCRACDIDDTPEDLRLTLDGAVTGRDHVTIVLAPVEVFDVLREDIMRRLKKGGKSDGQKEG